jgi:hypothetical protein
MRPVDARSRDLVVEIGVGFKGAGAATIAAAAAISSTLNALSKLIVALRDSSR